MSELEAQKAYERETKPSAWKGLIFVLLLAVIAVVIGTFVVGNRLPEGPKVAEAKPIPLSVETMTVALEKAFTVDEKFTGIITPRRTSQLGFSSGGRIESLSADVGDRVRSGRTLATLDVRGLTAQLAAAEAVVAEAEASHALALATVQRQSTLSEKGHVSQQRVDEATAQANTAAARIAAAQANADTLRVQIDLAKIVAPYSGTITARMSDEGAIAGPGTLVFELVESGRLEARIGLTAKLAATMVKGQTYKLTTDQGEVSSKLRSVTGVIDTGQRTVTTIFDILEPEQASAGAVVRIGLAQRIEESGFWVPVSALLESDHGLWSVYVAREVGGEWLAQPGVVEIVHQAGDRVFVRGAVRDGDRVILDGLQRITPGQPVTPAYVEPISADVEEG
jgi:RND family efflux transporter MFP subunit